ncbi:hypothetical protein BGT96224_3827 [Blumeria graminis f. sp. tritici 96224]|nr:hypothetical protein BGT96224_3827 [Blumeria graminis f. sp. tritici 96224]
MSFAVELPGEVAPLTTEEVCRALKSAVCSDNHSIQTGALQLQACSKLTAWTARLII